MPSEGQDGTLSVGSESRGSGGEGPSNSGSDERRGASVDALQSIAAASQLDLNLPSQHTMRLAAQAMRGLEHQKYTFRLLDENPGHRFLVTALSSHGEELRKLAALGRFNPLSDRPHTSLMQEFLSAVDTGTFQNALMASSSLQDLAGSSLVGDLPNATQRSLVAQAVEASKAYESVATSLALTEGERLQEMREAFALPTISFERSATVLSREVPDFDPRFVDEPGSTTDRPSVNTSLEDELERLDSAFARAYRGVIYTTRSENPDGPRHAAVSARELVRGVLSELAPKEVFSDEELKNHGHGGKPTRRMRVRYILGESLGSNGPKLVERLADLTTALYDYTSDVTHTGREVPEEDLALILEAYLVNLLRQAGRL